MTWPFDPLTPGSYRVILADPPWKFSAGKSRNPSNHYSTMTLKDIAALPVRDLAHPDGSRLFMWVTAPILLLPFGPKEILKAWGFRYSSTLIWRKLWPREDTMFQYHDSQARGTGFEVTGDYELLVIGKRGKVQSIRGNPFRGVYSARRREHSRKPDTIRAEIDARLDGPKAEIFGRQSHDGWDVWGNEATKFDGVKP